MIRWKNNADYFNYLVSSLNWGPVKIQNMFVERKIDIFQRENVFL